MLAPPANVAMVAAARRALPAARAFWARRQQLVDQGAHDVAPEREIARAFGPLLRVAAESCTDHRGGSTATPTAPLRQRSGDRVDVTVDVHHTRPGCNSLDTSLPGG